MTYQRASCALSKNVERTTEEPTANYFQAINALSIMNYPLDIYVLSN